MGGLVVLLVFFGSIIWVYVDAKKLGEKKGISGKELSKELGGVSPLGWLFCTLLFWAICFPAYLYFRYKFLKNNA
jgi:hypothetical protein